ncbi:MAG: ester cyclase [Acetobacteraceae bacterium]|nr:ester cyclase [Acetobacteraceae bacterium]
MTVHSTPSSLVERFYNEVWNRADEVVAQQILHKDLRFTGSLKRTVVGVENFFTYLRSIDAALRQYTCEIEDLIATETHVAARMRFHGVHQDTFFGVPATGKTIEWIGAAFFTVHQGLISEIWVLGDVDAVKRQLELGTAASFDR